MITLYGCFHTCGGGGTETLGAVELLRARNVPVRMIVPAHEPVHDAPAVDHMRRLGVEYGHYDGFGDDTVISWCEGKTLFPLVRADRPRYAIYSDCMYYASADEVDWWKHGLFDEFLFQTPSLARKLSTDIEERSGRPPVYRDSYRAFINVNSTYFPLRFSTDREPDKFRVLKVGRNHAEKWHPDTWRMFCGVNAPKSRLVEIEVCGWGDASAIVAGDIRDDKCKWKGEMNVTTHKRINDLTRLAGIYNRAHVLIHVCNSYSEEALGRVLLEAAASGVVAIADNRGGARELIVHGETGYLVDTPDEASYYASHMAFNDGLRRKLARGAYDRLINGGNGDPNACWKWWEEVLNGSTN